MHEPGGTRVGEWEVLWVKSMEAVVRKLVRWLHRGKGEGALGLRQRKVVNGARKVGGNSMLKAWESFSV
ncbi:hypothetical protein V6N11_058600 [Hibiscus sabdariffa]|uniref:Uncharacterized protein n=1 Tax=Hibiscus sabdariffa TaxID=183260 RepID=A0ABR2U5A9_9ROSI